MLRSLLPALLLAAGLTGQVPYRHLIVMENTGAVSRTGLQYLDPDTGVVTPLLPEGGAVLQRFGGAVALDPADPKSLYTAGGLSTSVRPTFYKFPLQGARHGVPINLSTTSLVGPIQRLWVYGQDMLLSIGGANGGLFRMTLGTTAATRIATLANAFDIVVIGTKAYVHSYAAGTTSTIVEVDLTTNTATTFGTGYPALRSLTLLGPAPVGGSDDGRLLLLNPGGSVAVLASPNRGPVLALCADPVGGRLWYATANEVWSFPNLTLVQTFAGAITDIDVGPTPRASLVLFGQGCPGSGARIPRQVWQGEPALGNASFALQVADGRASAPAFLLLGGSRTAFGGLQLPYPLGGIGMTGCTLYTDVLVVLGLALDAGGTGSVPLPIPNQPGLAGGRLTGQFVVLDPGANALGLVSSDGAEGIMR